MTYIARSVGEDWVCVSCGARVHEGEIHICGGSSDSGTITFPSLDIDKFVDKAPSAATEDYLRRIAEALEDISVALFANLPEDKRQIVLSELSKERRHENQ